MIISLKLCILLGQNESLFLFSAVTHPRVLHREPRTVLYAVYQVDHFHGDTIFAHSVQLFW